MLSSIPVLFPTTLVKIARFKLHLRAKIGQVAGSVFGPFLVFFLYVPVAGRISSSIKYNIDKSIEYRV